MTIEKIEIVRAQDLPLRVRNEYGITTGFVEIKVSSSVRTISVTQLEGRLSGILKQLLSNAGLLNTPIFGE